MTNGELAVLLGRVSARDREAFAALYRALERPVYAFVMQKLNDSSEAHDIVNETFLDVWKNAGTFEGRSAVKSWIFAIAYRRVIDLIRKRSKLQVQEALPETADDGISAENCLLAAESGAHLHHCLAQLKDDQRIAIRLSFFDDMSYREIANVVNAPEGTVKTRIFHAKQALLRCLSGRLSEKDIPS